MNYPPIWKTWMEDDSLAEDRERFQEAYLRIVGKKFDPKDAKETIEAGDFIIYEMPHFVTVTFAPDGASIKYVQNFRGLICI